MKTSSSSVPLTQEEKDKLLAKVALKPIIVGEKQWGVEYPYFPTAIRPRKSKRD